MSSIGIEQIKYLAKVAEWVETAPDDKDFYVQSVKVYLADEYLGRFVDEGDFWLFEENK